MSTWNMPPGVSTNDIPGNRPEDVNPDPFYEELDKKFVEKYGDNAKKWLTLLEDLDPGDMIFEYVEVARDVAYEDGYKEGHADAGYAQLYDEAERAERD